MKRSEAKAYSYRFGLVCLVSVMVACSPRGIDPTPAEEAELYRLEHLDRVADYVLHSCKFPADMVLGINTPERYRGMIGVLPVIWHTIPGTFVIRDILVTPDGPKPDMFYSFGKRRSYKKGGCTKADGKLVERDGAQVIQVTPYKDYMEIIFSDEIPNDRVGIFMESRSGKWYPRTTVFVDHPWK